MAISHAHHTCPAAPAAITTAAAVRDRISQRKGSASSGRMRIAARRTRGLLHLARQHGAFGRRLGREPGHRFAARVRRARPSPTAANRNRVTQALTRRRTRISRLARARLGLDARSRCRWLRVCLHVFECSSAWATAAHAMARRARAVLAAPSPPASPRNPRGAACPLSPRGDALRSARGVGGASSSTNMDSESDGMAGGIGDGVMPRQIRLPMPTCKAQASKAAIHDVARLPRAFPPSSPGR